MLTLILSFSLAGQAGCGWLPRPASTLPASLPDADFWRLSTSLSEPAGTFEHSDNLVSNELRFVHMARMLRPSAGVYVGVGPEQNFSYIARLRPAMAFVVDIRQENRNLHLLYKALFEVSSDRSDFISRLFSRRRAPATDGRSTVNDLFAAYDSSKPDSALHEATARLVRDRLLTTHGLPLTPSDLAWIDYALDAFYAKGPAIHYGRVGADESPGPSYRALMTAGDIAGHGRSYLATEEGFAYVKQLHARNLIVPIVGDFAGPHALRGVAEYIREHKAVVSAFYGSNVDVYLNNQQRAAFCANLAAQPRHSATWYIGSKDLRRFSEKLRTCPRASR